MVVCDTPVTSMFDTDEFCPQLVSVKLQQSTCIFGYRVCAWPPPLASLLLYAYERYWVQVQE